MEDIELSNNALSGKIPVQLGNSSLLKLKYLVLYENNLTGGIPKALANLSSLQRLSLSSNDLEGTIPDIFGRLTSLKFLSLWQSKLSGMIPSSIYNLSSLSFIDLSQNQLNGTLSPPPPYSGFNNLPNLQGFNAFENQLSGDIPVSISNASELIQLDLSENKFTGKLVSINWGSLQNLSSLVLGANHLGTGESDDLSFVTSLTNCSTLQILEVSDNNFGGNIPNSIANLSSQLITLYLAGNPIIGSVPEGIGNLVSLSTLWIQSNLLTGTLPTTIGKLNNLEEFYLSENGFSGPIPSSIGNLTKLTKLELYQNNFNGEIPSSLGNCKSLLRLNLFKNNLSGNIPQQIFRISSLSISLDLSSNNLIGPLPSEVGNLNNLARFIIYNNKLSGKIPHSLGQCRSILYLYMGGNLFQGAIPSSLATLNAIEEIDLSGNNLSGQIPKFLSNFTFLQYLNLSFNDLEGEVPKEGVFKNMSEISIIGNDKLCGGIPELHLPGCIVNIKHEKQGMSPAIKLIVIISCSAVLCFVFATTILILLYRRKKGKKDQNQATSLITTEQVPKISYQELLKATNAFSSANLIGSGSFGSVFKGILDRDGGVVAVKVLDLQVHGASKSFTAECEALRNIRHRNLVKVITSCSSIDYQGNDFKAIIYEFMPNGSLERWLHPEVLDDVHGEVRNLNFLQRLNIVIDIAAAMDYLHHHCETAIIHCDLKPNNILLDNDLTAYVSDFGLARFFMETTKVASQNQTSSLTIKGSIGYIAPEYGMGTQVSTQGDVYSYGILLLETFTGKGPTNVMFKDGLNLHNFSKMALPNRVMEISDPSLTFVEEQEGDIGSSITLLQNHHRNSRRGRIQECLISLVRIGISCSMESPGERVNMSYVSKELHLIKDFFLGVRKELAMTNVLGQQDHG